MTSQNPDHGWQRPEDGGVRPPSARLVDPEDELAATTVSGEPETTRIAPYPSAGPAPSTAYGLLTDPEPLPYVSSSGVHNTGVDSAGVRSAPLTTPPEVPAAPRQIAADADVRAAGRRGTQDLGLLLLRVALGVFFIAHGLQKAFGWWGGPGLDGFRTTLSEAGYQHAGVLSYVGAGAQIAAGALLVLGLFTPLAAAGALAFVVNALLTTFDDQRREGGIYVLGSPAVEHLVLLAVVAAAVILAGPGRYGFDGGRGWARRPFIGSFVALLLGAGGGAAAWFVLHGTNPFA